MILRNKDFLTIQTNDKDEIERLIRKGFINIYDDRTPLESKKKPKSTAGTKGKKYT